MRRLVTMPRLDRLLLALGLSAVMANTAQATVVPAVGLDQMISDAELIVRGEVAEVEARWSDDGATIYTYVTLSGVTVIHGQLFGPLTLRFEGGEIGDQRLEVDGMPTFRKGEEEILFVRANQVAASPVVGLFQGRFKVVKGLVYDHSGDPLVGVSDGTLVKLIDDRPAQAAAGISMGSPERAAFEYVENPDRDRIEAVLVAAAAEAARNGRPARPAPGKGTGVDHAAGPGGAAVAPPSPVSGGAAVMSAPKPAALYVPRSRDTGRRLTAAAFIDAIRAAAARVTEEGAGR